MKHQKILLASSIILVLALALIIATVFLYFIPQTLTTEPEIKLTLPPGEINAIVVHYKNGANKTVSLSTSDGEKLWSACEDILHNLHAQLRLATTESNLASSLNSSSYLDVTFEHTRNLTLHQIAGNVTIETSTNRTLFTLDSLDFAGSVLFPQKYKLNNETLWCGWGIETTSPYFQKLINLVGQP